LLATHAATSAPKRQEALADFGGEAGERRVYAAQRDFHGDVVAADD
jgi:hypothetical protein